ncbi:MAG: hypothetical protein DLM59_06280 [Pseudonocardiales bacterium]|nr:MAG: hypothetical protein DLM59_06280 [Pseudonocardiales bacterium]
MSHAFPACVFANQQRLVTDELASLIDTIQAGDVIPDRALVAVLGAAQALSDRHRIDGRGLCAICWQTTPRWWPRRRQRVCTVYETLGAFLSASG